MSQQPPSSGVPAPTADPPAVSMTSPSAAIPSVQPRTTTSAAGSPSPAPAPTPAPSTTAAPNGLATQYGMVMWPSLPGMQQAAVGVSPPPPPSVALMGGPGVGIIGRGGVDVTGGGRGGILTAVAGPGTPGGLGVGVGVAPPVSPPGINGDWSVQDLAAKARRAKQRLSNGSGRKEEPKTPRLPGDRDTMVVLRSACDACHRMKRKCDGLQPCNRCQRRSRPCGYSYKQKSGPPKGSKRKLIAADEDLLENRQPRSKLLPLTMWPNDSEDSRAAAMAAAAIEAAGGGAPADGASATNSPGANGINRLLAVGGHSQPPRLPGISIPPEGNANNGAGAAAAAAAVAAAFTAKPGAAAPAATRCPSPLALAAAMRSSPKSTLRPGDGTPAGSKDKARVNVRPIADLVLPSGAAQLSLEARAGAYRRAQEAAAAGMAAARAFVEGDFPTDKNGDFMGAKGTPLPTSVIGQLNQKQGIIGRIVSSPPLAGTPSSRPLPFNTVVEGVPTQTQTATASHESPLPMFAPSPASPKTGSLAGPPTGIPAAMVVAAAAASPTAQQVPGPPRPQAGQSPAPGSPQLPQQQQQQQHPQPHPGMTPQGMAAQGGVPSRLPPSMGLPMGYHAPYGMYQPYPQSLYAAYLAQYQLQQGINPYEGMYEGMNPYGNPAIYGHGGAAAAVAAVSAGSPGVAPTGNPASRPTHGIPSLPGVTGNAPPFSVSAAAAAAAIAAAARNVAAAGEKRPPKENEEAKQLAVETLLGLKNAQGSKGPLDEASTEAMAAVTAAAMSAATAAAQEAAAHATASGANDSNAASAAAAAAATAKAVAQAVAAAGAITNAKPPPAMGSRFDAPSVGEQKEPPAAVTPVVPQPMTEVPPAEAGKNIAPSIAGAEVARLAETSPVTPTVMTPKTPTVGTAEANVAINALTTPVVAPAAEEKDVLEGPKAAPVGPAVTAVAAPTVEETRVDPMSASPQTWAPVHGGPEEAASEAAAGRVQPDGPRVAPVSAVTTDGKQPSSAEPTGLPVSGPSTASQGRAIASSV